MIIVIDPFGQKLVELFECTLFADERQQLSPDREEETLDFPSALRHIGP